jgi:hypothetical protein
LNYEREIGVDKLNTLSVEVRGKAIAEGIQVLFDLDNRFVVLKIAVYRLNNKFTNHAVLAILQVSRHNAARTETQTGTEHIRREFLKQQLDELLSLLIDESAALWTELRRKEKANTLDELQDLLFRGVVFQIILGIAGDKLTDCACLILRARNFRLGVHMSESERNAEADDRNES